MTSRPLPELPRSDQLQAGPKLLPSGAHEGLTPPSFVALVATGRGHHVIRSRAEQFAGRIGECVPRKNAVPTASTSFRRIFPAVHR